MISITDSHNRPVVNLQRNNISLRPVLSPAKGPFQDTWDDQRSYEIVYGGAGLYGIRVFKFESITGEDPPEWRIGIYTFFVQINANVNNTERMGSTFVSIKMDI
jgi:hypothetical protein